MAFHAKNLCFSAFSASRFFPMSVMTSAAEPDSRQLGFLAPLVFFYGIGSIRPQITFLAPEELPAQAHHLLVHDSDMTPRLRDYHASPITLTVQGKGRIADYYVRAVVLGKATDGRAVEFGAIGIHLNHLSPQAQQMVLAESAPFGAILEQLAITHTAHPRGYFRIVIDQRLADLLQAQQGDVLYGRCNELRAADGQLLAEVVEVLPAPA
jgi:hypothetical protein